MVDAMNMYKTLTEVDALLDCEEPFEVAVGAVLARAMIRKTIEKVNKEGTNGDDHPAGAA